MPINDPLLEKYSVLVRKRIIAQEKLVAAYQASKIRKVNLEQILIYESGVPRQTLLTIMADYYKCPPAEFDERLPVPAELISAIGRKILCQYLWFPLIQEGNSVIILINDPQNSQILDEIKKFITAERYVLWFALAEDIQWYLEDFILPKSGKIQGCERTNLAYWRNTMALWRTRLACYRNDLAKARTHLSILRWGFGLLAIFDVMRSRQNALAFPSFKYLILLLSIGLILIGLNGYLKIRRSRLRAPQNQTLVEVTSATLHFVQDFHFIETDMQALPLKQTMLARLGDFLANHCTILYPQPASKERTHLARERNILAGQRTIAACYRTIYARARTGLAFIRTGVSLLGLSLALLKYFSFSMLTAFEFFLILAGLLMITDGLLWYLPVRKEQEEIPRSPVPE
jgi:uncharacterized membrane protein YidH (DUF202 family)